MNIDQIKQKIKGMTTDQIASIFALAQVPLFIIYRPLIIEAYQNKQQLSAELKALYARIDYSGDGPLPNLPLDMESKTASLRSLKEAADSEFDRLIEDQIPMVAP